MQEEVQSNRKILRPSKKKIIKISTLPDQAEKELDVLTDTCPVEQEEVVVTFCEDGDTVEQDTTSLREQILKAKEEGVLMESKKVVPVDGVRKNNTPVVVLPQEENKNKEKIPQIGSLDDQYPQTVLKKSFLERITAFLDKDLEK